VQNLYRARISESLGPRALRGVRVARLRNNRLPRLLFGSVSSPDATITVRLFGENSCIQAIGMLLIDFTSRASDPIDASHKGKRAA
jgi:hypothetical protein